MPKVIWSCDRCGTVLAMWRIKCTNCHSAALSWLHMIVVITLLVPAMFYLLRLIQK